MKNGIDILKATKKNDKYFVSASNIIDKSRDFLMVQHLEDEGYLCCIVNLSRPWPINLHWELTDKGNKALDKNQPL
jgi:hypothetical protein